MTMIEPRIKICAVCRVPKPMLEVVSLFSMASQDLDGRCGHTDFVFMQQCWWCGHCDPDIGAKVTEKHRDFVRSSDYRWHVNRPDLPGLARTFQCYSVLCEHKKDLYGAGHASLIAAWACDDAQHHLGGEYSRQRAVTLMTRALDAEGISPKEATTMCLKLADIYRCQGEFEEAVGMLDRIVQAEDVETHVRAIQERLISAKDTKRHNIKDFPAPMER